MKAYFDIFHLRRSHSHYHTYKATVVFLNFSKFRHNQEVDENTYAWNHRQKNDVNISSYIQRTFESDLCTFLFNLARWPFFLQSQTSI